MTYAYGAIAPYQSKRQALTIVALIPLFGYGREQRPPTRNSVDSTPTDLFSAMATP
ncbi:hypothetical protein MPLA_180098 [Mesorhizobium sp. ORS 3359]|nr:hypothetical protein MPLA_180098 [Mesorhizobium sp. ORS 3359]